MIHSTAVIHPRARIDPTTAVGPCTVIDEHVTVGPHCDIGPHAYLTGHTTIGAHNRFHAGCVIGDAPQDLKYRDEPTRLHIGDYNTFREHVTVHRSNKPEEDTVIGSHNFLMAHSHVGHNCVLGDRITLVNAVLLAGHVTVGEGAVLGGGAGVHQFVRIGRLAMAQGHASLSQDLPPFTVGHDLNRLGGLNSVGLRRAGVTSEERLALKRIYHLLFRGEGLMAERLAAARKETAGGPAMELIEFVAATKRGVCSSSRAGASED